MPVRRKRDKRREVESLERWETAFSAGFDFFRELPTIGIELDEYDRPPLDAAAAAWERLGAEYLAQRDPQMGPSWAEEQFGQPGRKRRAGQKT